MFTLKTEEKTEFHNSSYSSEFRSARVYKKNAIKNTSEQMSVEHNVSF